MSEDLFNGWNQELAEILRSMADRGCIQENLASDFKKINDLLPKQPDESSPPVDHMTDIKPIFHPVVIKYGRAMFRAAMAVQLGQQAAMQLLSLPEVNSSQAARVAVQIFVEQFNILGSDYLTKQGWTAEQMQNCMRDCALAYASQIVVPESGIILSH